ncbi:MAG: FACT complex subunit [Bathelium mastoideum]|nr:MAG: FACT complex subunit [Bathelium mastoideum]
MAVVACCPPGTRLPPRPSDLLARPTPNFLESFDNIYLDLSKQNGKCRFADSGLGWKPSGGGDTFTLDGSNIASAQWSRAAKGFELKVLTRNLGKTEVIQLDGFQQEDFDRINKAFKLWYSINLENREHNLRGWNWGKTDFGKAELTFNVQNRPAFEIPYTEISNTNLAGKNEVAVEFSLPANGEETGTNGHLGGARARGKKTGAARDQLVEMRFYIPGLAIVKEKKAKKEGEEGEDGEAEEDGEDVEEETNAANIFYDNLMERAEIGDVAGDTVATFLDVLHLTPRGRFDIDMYEKSFRLRGKTYDYKIQYESMKKFMLLPKPDDVHYLITIGLDPPLRQGQTRYPFLVMQFKKDEEVNLDLNMTEKDLQEKYANKLQANYEAPISTVIATIFRGLSGKKIITPSRDFSSHHQQSGVKCSIKANEGHLFCLDKSLMFVPKPATYLSLDQIQSITMSRVGGAISASRTFDITITMKGGAGEHQFSNINREEQNPLEDFFRAKNIKFKNEMADDSSALIAQALKDGDLASSDDEGGGVRGSASDDDEEIDEDFQEESESEVGEEFDSAHESSGSGSDEEMADADADAEADEDTAEAVERPKKKAKTDNITCRHRKLKCDEQKPRCGPCTRANRECVPSTGIVFRHQQNASMNGNEEESASSLKGFYAYKNTFDETSIWVDIPKHVTFMEVTDPYNEPLTPELERLAPNFERNETPYPDWALNGAYRPPLNTNTPSTHGLEALSAAASADHYTYAAPQASMARPELPYSATAEQTSSMQTTTPPRSGSGPMSPPMSMTSSQNNLNFILNPSSATSPPIDPSLRSSAEAIVDLRRQRPTSSPIANTDVLPPDPHAETDHEIAFLLRHFSEGPGLWMDLFDLGTFFASYVPVKATTNPLLKFSAVAYAAKALGRVQGHKPPVGGVVTHQARMELFPDASKVDWYHKAAKYYDTAVSLLRQALTEDASASQSKSTNAESNWLSAISRDLEDSPLKQRRLSTSVSSRSNSDELLAATAILCVYEFLDASGAEWARHLNGAKSLIDIAKDEMMPLQLPSPGINLQPRPGMRISKARKATFWNLARQDMLAAFINETHTRLDTEDLTMWREAGLLIDDRGFILPSNTTTSGYPEGDDVMREDMISNALIWLISKLDNFMAAGDDLPPELSQLPGQGINQRTLLDYWFQLREQFQVWHDGLPLTFKPCASVYPANLPLDEPIDAPLPEIWYSIPLCASTMQSFHFAQIQLLMNKPHESTQGRSTLFARVTSYDAVLAEVRVHARQIIGIALARPEASVRIHSVQPLYTAGQCLDDAREKRLVVKLLRDIERDIGWATEYRVKQLLKSWGWEEGREV